MSDMKIAREQKQPSEQKARYKEVAKAKDAADGTRKQKEKAAGLSSPTHANAHLHSVLLLHQIMLRLRSSSTLTPCMTTTIYGSWPGSMSSPGLGGRSLGG